MKAAQEMSHIFYNRSEAVMERYWKNPLSAIHRPVSIAHIQGYVERHTINEAEFYLSMQRYCITVIGCRESLIGYTTQQEIRALIDG